jgi:hypothetical protein
MPINNNIRYLYVPETALRNFNHIPDGTEGSRHLHVKVAHTSEFPFGRKTERSDRPAAMRACVLGLLREAFLLCQWDILS